MTLEDVGRAIIRATAKRLRGGKNQGDDAPAPSPPPDVQVKVDTTRAPDLAAWADESKRLVEIWHPKICELLPSERFRPRKRIKLLFKRDLGYPAHTSGVWVKTITISANWIRQHRDDFGLVIHELTHAIQAYPANRASWLVEGIADYIRYVHFEGKTRAPRQDLSSASYRDGYRTTAYFLRWLQCNYDSGIVAKLNAELRRGRYDDDLFESFAGKALPTLWSEYAARATRRRSS